MLERQLKLLTTMRKLFFIAAALFAAVPFSACSDDDDNGGEMAKPMLVKQMIYTDEENNESETRTIEYDDQNRICRITSDGHAPWTDSYSYSGNIISITTTDNESNEFTTTCELNEDGYIVKASDPYEPEESFHFFSYDNGYLQKWYTEGEFSQQYKYSWENGNLVSVEEPGAWQRTITYTQIAAAPSNFCIDSYVGDYQISELSSWGFMGRQSKFLPEKSTTTSSYDDPRTMSFEYEFNADKTISKISITEITEGTSYKERYYSITFVY